MASRIMNDEYISKVKQLLIDNKLDVDTRLRLILGITEQESARSVSEQINFLIKMGVSLRLMSPSVDTPHWEMYWLTRDEMKSFNVINTD